MDMRAILSVLTMLAVVGVALGMSAPASAVDPGWLLLYDTGDAGTADYVFGVETDGSVALDSEYLNFTVRSYPVVSGVGTEANWYMLVYLDDGTTNYSWNQTLAVVNDATVYSNISLASPGDYFVVNESAVLTLSLIDATFAEQDSLVVTFPIYSTEMNQAIQVLLPAVISIAMLSIVITMLNKAFRKRKT